MFKKYWIYSCKIPYEGCHISVKYFLYASSNSDESWYSRPNSHKPVDHLKNFLEENQNPVRVIIASKDCYQRTSVTIEATLLGNILLRSIVVSVLIRLINGYSVTDGTWLNLFLKIEGSALLVDALHVVLGIAPSPCDDSPEGHITYHLTLTRNTNSAYKTTLHQYHTIIKTHLGFWNRTFAVTRYEVHALRVRMHACPHFYDFMIRTYMLPHFTLHYNATTNGWFFIHFHLHSVFLHSTEVSVRFHN